MKYKILTILTLLSNLAYAHVSDTSYSIEELKKDIKITETLLAYAIETEQWSAAKRLLEVYQSFSQTDDKLINYANLRFAQQAFREHQNRQSRKLFQEVQNQDNLDDEEQNFIEQHLSALKQRENWQLSTQANYLNNKNVNNTSSDRQIENTGFIKNDEMLPQKATGFSYFAEITKNHNIIGSNNLHFSHEINGKSYWNNHHHDELNNRTHLGYAFQNAQHYLAIKPFYGQNRFSNHRYNKSRGIKFEYSRIFHNAWYFLGAFEVNQTRYFNHHERDNLSKTSSATLAYSFKPHSYFYLGADFMHEQAQEKQYSNNLKSLRAGWRHTWKHEIATQLNASAASRQYKASAVLGGILPLNKTRKDEIYTASATIWKNNWHWHGFTPKVQLQWKKQHSNIPSMFSYSDRYAQILIEKKF